MISKDATSPKTNISPGKWWLEDVGRLSSCWNVPFSGDMLIFRGVILSWFRSDKLNKWTPKNEFRFEMYHCSSKQITNKTHLTHLCQVCNLFYLGFRTCFKINLDSWCARIIMNHMGFWEEQCHSGKVFEQISTRTPTRPPETYPEDASPNLQMIQKFPWVSAVFVPGGMIGLFLHYLVLLFWWLANKNIFPQSGGLTWYKIKNHQKEIQRIYT